jgi:hypothetical protein
LKFEQLLDILIKKENYGEVITYAEKLILADKLHENAFTSLIKAHSLTGNYNMAKRNSASFLKITRRNMVKNLQKKH